jgi:hypothetical protein
MRSPLALALLLGPGVVAASGDCGGSPCVVLGSCTPSTSWTTTDKPIDGQTASNVGIKGNKFPNEAHLNCPGTTSPTGGSGPCHMWGSDGFSNDRNALLQVIGASGEIQIHSFPATKSAPVGTGLLNPGMCLTAGGAASVRECGSTSSRAHTCSQQLERGWFSLTD